MTVPPQEQTGKWFARLILCPASIASPARPLFIQLPYSCMLQAFVAIAFPPLWRFLPSLCGCFFASLCGCCFQAFVAVSCKPLWLWLASLCGCFLQASVAVFCKPLWLFLASLCGCFLEAFVAVCPKVSCMVHLLFSFGCSKFCFFCACISCPSFERGWCHVIQILRPCKHLTQSLKQHMPCRLSDLQPQSKLHLCTQENIFSSFTNDLHKVYRG